MVHIMHNHQDVKLCNNMTENEPMKAMPYREANNTAILFVEELTSRYKQLEMKHDTVY